MSGCFQHASKEAVGSCHNCGKLVCASCNKVIEDTSYCPVCVQALFTSQETKPSAALPQVESPPANQPVSNLWWLLPIFLSWVGGLVAWLINKNKEPKKAGHMLFSGIGMAALQIILIVIMIFALCVPVSFKLPGSSGLATKKITGPKELNPFTFNYKSSDSDYAFYNDGDSLVTLSCASPFYPGMQPLPGQQGSDYETARSKKVIEIDQESQKIVQAVNRLKPQVAIMRSAYLTYLSTCYANEKGLKNLVSQTMTEMVRLAVEEQVVEAQYLSFNQYKPINPFFDSYQHYEQVMKAVELGSLYLEDTNNIYAYAAISLQALESHSSSEIKNANLQLDKDFQALDTMRSDLAAIISSIEKIGYGLKQLETGNYYYARAAVNFIKDSLPELKTKVDGLVPNEYLIQEDIDIARDYLSLFELWQATLSENLDKVDKSSLIKISYQTPVDDIFVSNVYAADSVYTQAVMALAPPAQGSVDQSAGFFAKGWSTVKSGVHTVQNFVGSEIDTVGDAAFRLSRIGWGWTYGNAGKEICDDIRQNSKELNENYRRGLAGAETFKTADEYFTKAEEWAGKKVETGTGDISYISKGLGFVTKCTIGLFTGLGHGVSKLSNVNSTAGDYASGVIDIMGAFIGGSKVICKASQVPGVSKGLADMGKALLKKGGLWLKQSNARARINMKDMLKNTNWGDVKAADEYLAALNKQQEVLSQELKNLFKQGTTTAKITSKETVNTSWESLFKEQSVKDAFIKRFYTTAKEAIGRNRWDVLDTIVGQAVDDLLKDLAKKAIDGALTTQGGSGYPFVQINPRSFSCSVGDKIHVTAQLLNISDDLSPDIKYSWTKWKDNRQFAEGSDKEGDISFESPGVWEIMLEVEAKDIAGNPIRGADGGKLLHDTITARVSMPKVDITVAPADILEGKGDATKKYVFTARPENIPDGAMYTWNMNGQKALQGMNEIEAIVMPNSFKAGESYTLTLAVTWKDDMPGGYVGQVDRRATKSISFTMGTATPAPTPTPTPTPAPTPSPEPAPAPTPSTDKEEVTFAVYRFLTTTFPDKTKTETRQYCQSFTVTIYRVEGLKETFIPASGNSIGRNGSYSITLPVGSYKYKINGSYTNPDGNSSGAAGFTVIKNGNNFIEVKDYATYNIK